MTTNQVKIIGFTSIILVVVTVTFLIIENNHRTDTLKGQSTLIPREKTEIVEERKWLSKIPEEKNRKNLIRNLDQTLTSKETDEYGNIVQKINDKKRTFLGYPIVRDLYLESIKPTNTWTELKKLEKLPVFKASSTLEYQNVNIIKDLITNSHPPINKTNDNCFIEEKQNRPLGLEPKDSICAKKLFELGTKKINNNISNNQCVGIFKGFPIIQNTDPVDNKPTYDIPYINGDGEVKYKISWESLCFKYFNQIFTTKDKNWSYYFSPLTLSEAKKCINSNDHAPIYDKWIDNSCDSEICDNNIDDNNNGKIDCAEESCNAFTVADKQSRDAICAKNNRQFCSDIKNPFGTVINIGGFDALCSDNKQYKSWIECNTDDIEEKNGLHGITVTEGTRINSNSCNYICAKSGNSESWIGCGCNKGPDGLKANEGQSYSGYICSESLWLKENEYVDNLNKINTLFHRADYDPNGFMYWAYDLYKKGSFPLLPYLTPIKDQGSRGTCLSFADTAAAEIVLLKKPDLSEQNFHYLSVAKTDPYAQEDINIIIKTGIKHQFLSDGAKFNIGYENDWPYNPLPCTDGHYYSDLLKMSIPCSNKFHQGIPTGNPNIFDQYFFIKNTKDGSCVTAQNLDSELTKMSIDEKIAYLANIINIQHYPIRFETFIATMGDPNEYGFTTENFWKNGDKGHAMLIVGFVNKEDIPEAVKKHYHFINNEHYFIIKNSHGTGFGDEGFAYAPASLLVNNSMAFNAFKYDSKQEVYPNCPSQKVTIQIAN